MCTNGMPIPELSDADLRRFWAKVQLPDPDTGCMLWTAAKTSAGYGAFRLGGVLYRAHRISFTLAYGEIPQGMVLDHICRNRACVAPEHLEVVSQRENVLRGEGLAAQNSARTHCPRGHAYAGANLYVAPDGRRYCRTCRREKQRNYRRAKRIAQSVELTA